MAAPSTSQCRRCPAAPPARCPIPPCWPSAAGGRAGRAKGQCEWSRQHNEPCEGAGRVQPLTTTAHQPASSGTRLHAELEDAGGCGDHGAVPGSHRLRSLLCSLKIDKRLQPERQAVVGRARGPEGIQNTGHTFCRGCAVIRRVCQAQCIEGCSLAALARRCTVRTSTCGPLPAGST